MKKYTNLELKIVYFEKLDVMVASGEFAASEIDNDFNNSGFIPF